MADPIAIDKALYWQLRTALLEHQTLMTRLNQQGQASLEAINAMFVTAGLDPALRYQLHDATQTATVDGA